MTARQPAISLESGDPVDSADAYRRTLGQFATGVTVITAASNGRTVGVTANSFNSVSLEPPLILWSIKKTSTSWPVFEAADSFAVNILAFDQIGCSMKFAKSGADKFKGIGWTSGATGAPLLDDVAAHFDCVRHALYDEGDHYIIVGRVVHFARFDRRPLLFAQGRYSLAVDHVDTVPQLPENSAVRVRPTILTLLRLAFLQRTNEFREEASQAGFTINESRLMYHLEAQPGCDIEQLARVALIDLLAARDCIADLTARGWVTEDAGGNLAVTPLGAKQNSRLREIAWAAESAKLARFSESQVNAALEVLAAFGGRLDMPSGGS